MEIRETTHRERKKEKPERQNNCTSGGGFGDWERESCEEGFNKLIYYTFRFVDYPHPFFSFFLSSFFFGFPPLLIDTTFHFCKT